MFSSRLSTFFIICLIFVTSVHAFFAPFLHKAAASLGGDVASSSLSSTMSRTRRNTIPTVITPDILGHSEHLEIVHHLEQHKNSSSMFMVELYESLYTGHNLVNPTPQECRAIEAADTVRSYTGYVRGANLSTSNVMTWQTSFPTYDQPVNEAIHLAELRIQLNTTSNQESPRQFVIQLSQWIDVPCNNEKGDGNMDGCRKHRVIHSREINAHHDDFDGREVFDITKIVHRWMTSANDDAISTMKPVQFGIELRAKPVVESSNGGNHNKEVVKALLAADHFQEEDDADFVDDVDIDGNGAPVATSEDVSLFEPTMIQDVTLVVFSRASHKPVILSDAFDSVRVRRRRRSTEEARRRKKQKEYRKYQREQHKLKMAEKLRIEQEQTGPCRRVDMHVDFGRIGWDEWIIYPKQFNAYRCVGTCAGPLDSSDNPSNHAIMQDLIRIYQPERRTPEPCCVPTKLRPLSMLYFEEGAVLVRHHENMIVQECGCQ